MKQEHWTAAQYRDFMSRSNGTGKRKKRDDGFDSYAESLYFNNVVYPGILTGEIIKYELHKKFEILDPIDRMHTKVYTLDFLITYKDGRVKAVEVKGKQVKKLQRDFQLRWHLFVEKYCKPNNWEYEIVKSEELTGGRK